MSSCNADLTSSAVDGLSRLDLNAALKEEQPIVLREFNLDAFEEAPNMPETEVTRGCDSAAFDEWADRQEEGDDMLWDGATLESMLMSVAGEEPFGEQGDDEAALAQAQLQILLRPHRIEALTPGGTHENLVHSHRPFHVAIEARGPVPQALAVKVSLVFAESGADVPPSKGEAPLAGETEATLPAGGGIDGGGTVQLQLRVAALSYRHGSRPFALRVCPADPQLAHRLPALSALSAPMRAVARLPNAAAAQKAAAATAPAWAVAPSAVAPAAPAAPPAFYLDQSRHPASPSASVASSFSASSSPPPSPHAAAVACAPPPPPHVHATPVTSSHEQEVQRLQQLLATEASERQAYRAAFEAQAEQLRLLAAQQAQILQQMQCLREERTEAPPAQAPQAQLTPMPGLLGW